MSEGSPSMYRDALMEIFNTFKIKMAPGGGAYAVNLKDIEAYFLKMRSTNESS